MSTKQSVLVTGGTGCVCAVHDRATGPVLAELP